MNDLYKLRTLAFIYLMGSCNIKHVTLYANGEIVVWIF